MAKSTGTNRRKTKNRRSKLVVFLLLFVIIATALVASAFQFFDFDRHNIGFTDKTSQSDMNSIDWNDSSAVAEWEKLQDPNNTEIIGTEKTPIYKKEPIDQDIINILLLGCDISTGNSWGRSDTMIVVSYNVKTDEVNMMSLLRDSWVPIDGYGWNKLNAAYSRGGPGLTINTVNELYSLDIQRYVMVDFDGLEKIVDTIGGLDLELTAKEVEYINNSPDLTSPNVLTGSGVMHLDGNQVLEHARNRTTGGSDFHRTNRQRQVLMAIYEKAKTIRNPVTLLSLATTCKDFIVTNIPFNTMFSLGMGALNADNLTINSMYVPADGTYTGEYVGNVSVVGLDIDANAEIIHEAIYGNTDNITSTPGAHVFNNFNSNRNQSQAASGSQHTGSGSSEDRQSDDSQDSDSSDREESEPTVIHFPKDSSDESVE